MKENITQCETDPGMFHLNQQIFIYSSCSFFLSFSSAVQRLQFKMRAWTLVCLGEDTAPPYGQTGALKTSNTAFPHRNDTPYRASAAGGFTPRLIWFPFSFSKQVLLAWKLLVGSQSPFIKDRTKTNNCQPIVFHSYITFVCETKITKAIIFRKTKATNKQTNKKNTYSSKTIKV